MTKVLPVWEKDKVVFNNKDLPSGFRAIIVGQTGLGKTTLLLKLLIYNLDFENLIICSPSLLYQTEYKILINGLKRDLICLILKVSSDTKMRSIMWTIL